MAARAKSREGKSQAGDKTSADESLELKINAIDPDIQRYIAALKLENEKLTRKIVRCEAEKVRLYHGIKLLEEQIEEEKKNLRAWELLSKIKHDSSKE